MAASDSESQPGSRRHSDDGALMALVDRVRGYVETHGALPAERKLAEALDVKRHQLRRALKLLFDAGDLVPATTRRRSPKTRSNQQFAGQIAQNSNPLEVIELRLMIEPGLARLAALRATPPMIAAIRKAASNRRGAPDAGMSRLIALASGNSLAAEFQHILERIATEINVQAPDDAQDAADVADGHLSVAAAIAERDPDGAERGMRAHLLDLHARIISSQI